MADNVAITAGSGTSIAADDIGSVFYQRVKPAIGPDGTANDVLQAAAALNSTGTGIPNAALVGQFDDASTQTVTEDQFAHVRISTRRALLVEGVASGTAVPVSGTVTATVSGGSVAGTVAHDGNTANNPVTVGGRAVAHGSNPSAVAAGDVTDGYYNRAGVKFVIGGHPNVVTVKHTTITTAVTDAAIVTVGAGTKIVVTRLTVTLDNASTVFPTVLIGFGTANTPTTTGVIASHGGVPAGGGFSIGDGSGILGIGADNEDLRVTTTGNATGNGLHITVSYFTIES